MKHHEQQDTTIFVEVNCYRSAEQNKDEVRIEGRKSDGTPYTIIADATVFIRAVRQIEQFEGRESIAEQVQRLQQARPFEAKKGTAQ
jgi:hypothetical protein